MSELVECYSGHTYAGRPKALYWQGTRLEVSEILKEWLTPGCIHYLVTTNSDESFLVTYDMNLDQWFIQQS